ncbi:hypothetical protein TWF696_002914 [Orbilia brochopaga]|uniref:Lysine-specific metallo-endopeptidase domain-containing protein n=1 Tax=Orbilia brochopaga TaxID=3140254 RepID=A0AAV9U0J3_9PEZI
MKLFATLLYYTCIFSLISIVSAAVDIASAYEIVRPPMRGSCSNEQIEFLHRRWEECAILIQNGYDMMLDLRKRVILHENPEIFCRQKAAVLNLASWFNIRAQDPFRGQPDENGATGVHSEPEDEVFFQEHFELVSMLHSAVHDSDVATHDGQKPKLYCSLDWVQRQDPEVDHAIDADGNVMTNPDGTPMLLRDDPEYRPQLYNPDGTRKDAWIWLLPDEHVYFILPTPAGLCDPPLVAFTSTTASPVRVTLCEPWWIPMEGATADTGKAWPRAADVVMDSSLESFRTKSAILLHETVHVVLTALVDPGDDEEDVAEYCTYDRAS